MPLTLFGVYLCIVYKVWIDFGFPPCSEPLFLPPSTVHSFPMVWFSSVQLLICAHSLWPHGLQHSRPPSPSPTPGTCSNSCPLSQWCHPTLGRVAWSYLWGQLATSKGSWLYWEKKMTFKQGLWKLLPQRKWWWICEPVVYFLSGLCVLKHSSIFLKKKLFLTTPWDMCSSRPRIEPHPPVLEAQTFNHWTTREVPPVP